MSIQSIYRYVLAWSPFFILWTLFVLAFSGDDPAGAVVSGFTSTAAAALPGLLVWRMTGRIPWPDRLSWPFCLFHLVVAAPYALVWAVSAYVVNAYTMGEPILETIRTSEVFAWRVLMGLWLYALVAGVSYAVRNRDRLREQQRIAARAEALALEARLEALRAQLNPHFLFNALHSVNALIRRDPAKAEQAVEELASLLRYALDEGNESLVSLDDEWAFTQGYLRLQKIRFGDRLRYSSRFDEGTLACRVPPFILQPLVENAVEHGISNRTNGGEVEIVSTLEDEFLRLEVKDSGAPQLNGRSTEESGSGLGSGLAVLRQRLDALYGDEAKVEINKANGRFATKVTIPV